MTSPVYFTTWEQCCTIGLRVVGYYIQHRYEPIDRHLLSPSGLGLLHLVASPLSILDDHQGDYDKEKPSGLQTLSRGAPGMVRGPYGVGPRKRTWWRGYEETKTTQEDDSTKDTTTTWTLHWASQVKQRHKTTQDNTRQRKTTQDTRTTRRTGKNPDSEKRNGPWKAGIVFRTSKEKRVLVGAIERVGCGTSLGAKRSY